MIRSAATLKRRLASRGSAEASRRTPCATARAPLRAANVAMGHQARRHHRIEHRPDFVTEVKSDRRDAHRRPDAGGRLTGQVRRDSLFKGREHVAKTAADTAVRSREWTLRGHEPQVQIGEPFLVDATAFEQHVAQGEGLLSIVCVQARHSPPMRLPLPRHHAVHVVCDATVVRLDLLRAQPLKRGTRERRPQPNPTNIREPGQPETDEASWQCSWDANSHTRDTGGRPPLD